ncbi:hypothetical protein A8806_110180 [Faecalicatena orotica]|uniref:Uncharacterized protein n=1 Tax=Faecalicatena orotica TaxID=1544 RepID=A0A2Y9BHG4_9FIRM|nr:hypothetical protein [Faecalicatena orotica]PWJ28005.1 hypothetical protein A8806_110180 [Faecalicatena orotica]SSA57028.1 hypothetical protein SAMN05216536_110180 [Faecalicatena orotica]
MKKYNLSKIMKRAWELVKVDGMDISSALKKSWKEEKSMKEENIIETLKSKLEEMASNDYHINLGIEREVSEKKWEKNGQKRTYLSINCYTLSGKFKGSYKCGYVDMVTNEYVCGKYDDVNAADKEYVGR